MKLLVNNRLFVKSWWRQKFYVNAHGLMPLIPALFKDELCCQRNLKTTLNISYASLAIKQLQC